MAVTENLHTGNGSKTNYSFTFPYLKTTDIKVSVDGTVVTNFTAGTPTATEIQFNTAPANNAAIRIYRDTATDKLSATFFAGSAIKSQDLNDNFLQNLYVTQEAKRDADAAWQDGDETISSTETWVSNNNKVATTGAIDGRVDTKIDTALTTDVSGGDGVTIVDNSPGSGQIRVDLDADIATLKDMQSGAATQLAALTSAELAILDGATVTTAEVNLLDGVTATTSELNILDGVTANKDELNLLDGVTATTAELNILDGVTATTAEINTLDGVTATTAELNILDGVTATTAELNILDGVTATTDELNKTDGLTSTPVELNILDGATVNTSEINKLDGVTASTAELNIVAGKSFKTSSGTLDTTSDTEIPSSKVIAAHVASSQTAIGGFTTIADEVSFPNTQPANGVVVSINNAAGVVINGSGVSTTGKRVDNTTVTINGFPSSLYGETLAAGVGLIVVSTSTANTYNYHKILSSETDVKQLSDDINDFNARYRIASSPPSSNNDEGDLYFDTAANKMKVYNGSAWDDVASVGSFFINTLSSSSGTGGGSATFNGSAYRFTLSNAGTSAQQLIVSVNGVIQKPNAGTSQPSEGFAVDGNDIIFSAAPASGSDYFIVTCGSSVSIGTPSANSVNSSHIIDGSIVNGDISSTANIAGSKVADDSIPEGKLDVHNAPATGKYLKYTSNGMEWSDGASEGTDVKSTGESGTTKFLRVDGDGSCSWQVPPDTNTQLTLHDEDNFASNSATAAASQQSIKAYVDTQISSNPSGSTFTATADGAIANNKPVKINTNGTVTEIRNIITAHSSPVISPSTTTSDVGKKITATSPKYQRVVWDGNHKIFISLYSAASDGNIHAHIVTPGADGSSSPSPGDNFDLNTNRNAAGFGSDFDPDNNRLLTVCNNPANGPHSGQVVYFFTEVTNATTLTPKSTNGTSTSATSYGTLESYETGNTEIYAPRVCYIGDGTFAVIYHTGPGPGGAPGDRDVVKIAIFEWDGSNTYSNQINTSVTAEGDPGWHFSIAKISNGKFVMAWKGDDNKGHYRIGNYNTSNNTLTQGTAGKFADYNLASVGNVSVAYDETAGKVLFLWQKDSLDDRYFSAVGTISGNDISVGSEVQVDSRNSETPAGQNNTYHGKILNSLLYIPANEKISLTATYDGHRGDSVTAVVTKEATISGTSVSWSTGYNLQTTGLKVFRLASAASNLDEGTILHHYQHTDYNWNHCKQVTYNSVASNLTADEQYVGFADAAYTNGQTATIKTVGNNVTTLSGLTTGTEYYVQPNGTLATTAGSVKTYAGTALSASKLLIQPQVSEAATGWQVINSSKIETGHSSDPIISESLSDAYQLYRVQYYFRFASDDLLGLRIKHSDTWQTSTYWYQGQRGMHTTQYTYNATNNANRIYVGASSTGRIINGNITFGNVGNTDHNKTFKMETGMSKNLTGGYANGSYVDQTIGGHNSTAAITGLRFHCGNITEGWFVLEGLKI